MKRLPLLLLISVIFFVSIMLFQKDHRDRELHAYAMSSPSLAQLLTQLKVQPIVGTPTVDGKQISVQIPSSIPPGHDFPIVIIASPSASYSSTHAWFTVRFRFFPLSQLKNIKTAGLSDHTQSTYRPDETGSIGQEYTWQNNSYLPPTTSVYIWMQATAAKTPGKYPLFGLTYEKAYGGEFSKLSTYQYTVKTQ